MLIEMSISPNQIRPLNPHYRIRDFGNRYQSTFIPCNFGDDQRIQLAEAIRNSDRFFSQLAKLTSWCKMCQWIP